MNWKKTILTFKSYEKNLAAKSSPKVSFFVPFWIFGAPAASTNHLAIRGLMYDLTHGAWEPWSFLQAKILFKKQGTTRWWPRFMVKLHETCSSFPMPKCGSMGLVIFTYHGKWLILMGSVGKYAGPVDPMGILMFWCQLNINSIILVTYVYIIISSLRSAFLLESGFSENEWGIPKIVGKGKKTAQRNPGKKKWPTIRWDLAQTQRRESRYRWVYQKRAAKTHNSLPSHHTGWFIVRGSF